MIEACVFYALIGSLDPTLQFNDGMRDVVRIVLKPRTVTNADPPSPVSNYQMVNLKLVDVILEALGQLHPARAIANGGSSSALSIAWSKARPGQSTMQYEIIGSAYGGGMGHDGATGTATHLSNLHITPIEILESEYPCRIRRFELVPDSGGAGRWRGGLSLLARIRTARRCDRDPAFRQDEIPAGRTRRREGRRTRAVRIKLGTQDEHDTPASGRYEMKAGERFLLQTAAGGGYGDPALRDRTAIERDIAEGYVTRERAGTEHAQDLAECGKRP